SRGIEFEERGLVDEARAAYTEAARLDPRFAMARERRDMISVTAADQQRLDDLETRAALAETGDADRLMATGAAIGLESGPAWASVGLTPASRSGPVRTVVQGKLPR